MRFYAPNKMIDQELAAQFIIFAIKQANDGRRLVLPVTNVAAT